VKLSDSEQAAIEAALRSLCPSWPPAGGYRNRNYKLHYNGEHYVLRIASPENKTDFGREQELLSALSKLFPETRAGITLDYATTFASYMEEGLLLSRWCSAPLLADCYGVSAETLGTYLANLHSCLARLPRNVVSIGTLKSDIRSYLDESAERWVTALPKPRHAAVVCHLDLNPWNLLLKQNHWVTLDWETAALADPLFDLVTLCDGYLREHNLQTDREAFSCAALTAYNLNRDDAQTEYPSDALDDARAWYQWREYSWACAQLASGNSREEIVLQRDFFAGELVERGFDIIPG